jgi:hypothetical protein
MSKKKNRHKGERINNENSSNRINNAPFGINPAQLMSMLGGNIDMGQIGNMLSSMKMDGLDLNNFNLGQLGNNAPNKGSSTSNRIGFDLGSLQGMMNNLGMGGFNLGNNNSQNLNFTNLNSENDNNLNIANEENNNSTDESIYYDENIQMLVAIKSIVDSKKAIFLDKVIEAYNNGYFK